MTHMNKTRAALQTARARAEAMLQLARGPHRIQLEAAETAVRAADEAVRTAAAAHQRSQQQFDQVSALKVDQDVTDLLTRVTEHRDAAAEALEVARRGKAEADALLCTAQEPIRGLLDLCAELTDALTHLDAEDDAVGRVISGYEEADRRRAEEERAARYRCRTCNDDPAHGYCRDCDPNR